MKVGLVVAKLLVEGLAITRPENKLVEADNVDLGNAAPSPLELALLLLISRERKLDWRLFFSRKERKLGLEDPGTEV